MKFLRSIVLGAVALFACVSLAAPAAAVAPTPGVHIVQGGTSVGDAAGLVTRPFAISSSWQATVTLSSGTNTALHASCGTGLKNYVVSLDYSSLAATTAVELDLNDNTTAVWKTNIGAGAGGRHYSWDIPKVGTAATAVNVQLSGSPTGAVLVNASGFCGS
jgi:hypothetical protein